jgi:hypothetical protein
VCRKLFINNGLHSSLEFKRDPIAQRIFNELGIQNSKNETPLGDETNGFILTHMPVRQYTPHPSETAVLLEGTNGFVDQFRHGKHWAHDADSS